MIVALLVAAWSFIMIWFRKINGNFVEITPLMFTLQELKTAHSKVKTGADFPSYVQEISSLGLRRYEYMVNDGTTIYYGDNGHTVQADPIYETLHISGNASSADVSQAIQIHQEGQTDFLTFCRQVALAGVDKWVVDTQKMVCTYYDVKGNVLVEEPISLM